MYIFVFSRKKPLSAAIIVFLSFLLMSGIYILVSYFIPESEITLEQRISVILPNKTEMHTIYMKTLNLPSVEAGSLAGVKWKTEIIHQPEMSDITFKYPETLRLDEIKTLAMILQSISIIVMLQNFMVFQVWNMKQPLDGVFATSRKYSSMTFLDFKQSKLRFRN